MNEQALKARLKHIAKSENRLFQEVWKLLCLERLLVRIAKSDYHEKFVFKGGLLLSHYLYIGRETKDIDLHMRQLKANSQNIQKAFTEICNIQAADAFNFEFDSIEELDHTHMNYPGYRVHLKLQLEKMTDRIQVNIGTGDLVESKIEPLELSHYRGKPIFEGSVSLQVYPIETIFAEKLESVIYRGASNSRMKDYHDLLLLCREQLLLNTNILASTIENTFKHRNTDLSIPLTFNEEEYAALQSEWSLHLRKLDTLTEQLKLPLDISELIEELNHELTAYLVPA